jgi:hypothetical protein
MNGEQDKLEVLGQRAGELLRTSADELDGATRSRLARARAAALQQHTRPRRWQILRQLAPVGAVAAAALVAVLLTSPDAAPLVEVNLATTAALYDLELLADADAWELSQEADLEFIEWAAAMTELEGAGG